jgi:hypothetical protein
VQCSAVDSTPAQYLNLKMNTLASWESVELAGVAALLAWQ